MARKFANILKPFKNLFVLALIVFGIWMLFFDTHSYLLHRELNQEIEDLQDEKEYYQSEMAKDQEAIDELSTEKGVEKTARETYFMKRPDEEIYIIEYEDSRQKQNKNE
jgi:cell division protein FtsB